MAKEAAERSCRAERLCDLMADIPDALEAIRGPDQRASQSSTSCLGGDDFRAFLADSDALDAASDPGAFWANWMRANASLDRRTEGDGRNKAGAASSTGRDWLPDGLTAPGGPARLS
jgi:hypothetical protein